MKINCGIIGLPNVGKSTLFKFLTNVSVKIDNFPFCTIQPNIATVQIPDSRLYQLNSIIPASRIVHGMIEFIDIAGLIKGASQGEGLGNQILNRIRTAKVLCHMVRCFDNDTIFHIENNIDPCRDINIINTEFILFDILQCEKSISFLQKNYKIINKCIDQKLFILKKCLTYLYNGVFLHRAHLSILERKNIQEFNFLTFKPIIYIANVNDKDDNNIYIQKLNIFGSRENVPVIQYCGAMNNIQSALLSHRYMINIIIKNILSLLKINTFFTVNSNMIRAWINIIGATALDSSYNVHSDFKKGFIRAQVIKFNDFIKHQGEAGSKKAGKVNYVGKNYFIEDGDILKFLFHV